MDPYTFDLFQVKEYLIQDVDNSYNPINVPIYDITVKANGQTIWFDAHRLVSISKCEQGLTTFRFICMNKFSRRSYDRYDGYTDIVVDLKHGMIQINQMFYLARCKDAKIFDRSLFRMNHEVIQFLSYLYKNFYNMNQQPRSRI